MKIAMESRFIDKNEINKNMEQSKGQSLGLRDYDFWISFC